MRQQEGRVPSAALKRWADMLKERELVDIAFPLLDILKVWGFVGGQVLWMLTPFLGKDTIRPLAQALEEPETLQQLQYYLIEEEIADCLNPEA